MKILILAILIGLTTAKPINDEDQHVAVTQDTAGNYKINVNVHGFQKTEQGNADGSVSGSYSYIGENGELQMVQYTAGRDGFRTVSGTNLPVAPFPVQDTPEVIEARRQHVLAHESY